MVDEADRARFRQLLNQLSQADLREEFVGSIAPVSGRSFRAAFTNSVDRNAKGQVKSIRWSMRDISSRDTSSPTRA
jgi:hypothetical protein